MADLPIGWVGARGGIPLATWFLKFMASHLRGGTLTVVDPTGTHRFGDGAPEVTMIVHDSSVYWSTLRQGSVGLGRDYTDGLWDCDELTTLTRVLSHGLRPVTAVQDKVGQVMGHVDRLVPPPPPAPPSTSTGPTSSRTTTCPTTSSPSCWTRR